MKKILRTGKKALALFLTVVMVMTAWVFVEPTKASAVTAGNYYFSMQLNTTDNALDWEDEHLRVSYKTENGTNSSTNTQDFSVADAIKSNGTHYITGSVPGFPTNFEIWVDPYWNRGWTVKIINISIGKDSSNCYHTLWSGDEKFDVGGSLGGKAKSWSKSIGSSYYPKATTAFWNSTYVNSDGTLKDETLDKKGEITKDVQFCLLDQYGVRMSTTSLNASHLNTPAGVSISTDASDPTIGDCTTTTNNPNWYYSLTTSDSSWNKLTLHMKNAMRQKAKKNNLPVDSQKITVKVKAGNTVLDTKTFNLSDPTYKFTFDPNGGTLTNPKPESGKTTGFVEKKYAELGSTPSASRTGFDLIGFFDADLEDSYENDNAADKSKITSTSLVDADKTWFAAWRAKYNTLTFNYRDANNNSTSTTVSNYFGRTYTVPTPPSGYEVNDITYTFEGWKEGENIVIPPNKIPANNTTYTATYSSVKHYADYTEVDAQVARANEKMATDLYKNGGYTADTVRALENALKAVVRDLGVSQQQIVNNYAIRIRNAVDSLKIKTFTVLFVDEDGAIIKDGYHYVKFGDSVTVPATPQKSADATNHYVFNSWDTTDSDGLDALNYVTDDLKFIAKFDTVPHNWKHETVDSGCTTDGVIKHTCLDCGYSYTEVNEADTAHHQFEEQVIVAATCSAVGYKANVCKNCGAIEANSKQEIAKKQHTFGDWTEISPATCYGKGIEKRTCSVCGAFEVRDIPQLSHSYGASTVVAPTCTTGGHTERTCSRCGFVEITNKTDPKGHTLTTDRKEATCASVGYERVYCTICGHEESFAELPLKTEHSWSGWTTEFAATCTGKGVEKRVCSVCGKEEVKLTDMIEHTRVDMPVVAPTCISTGLTAGVMCSVCGKVLTPQETIPAINHSNAGENDWVVKQAATCTGNGYKVQICPDCNLIINTDTIAPIGHKWIVDDTTDANGWKTTTPATCTTDGEMTRVCEHDSTHIETMVIPAAHTYETIVHNATCTEPGYTEHKCKVCGDTYNTDLVQPTGHDWDEGVATYPNCTDNGTLTLTCKNDSTHTMEKTIAPQGHHFVEDTDRYVEATNDNPGQRVYVCDRDGCDEEYIVEIPAQGHEFAKDEALSKAPTCTEAGYNIFKCTEHDNCGITYREELPALGHDFDDAIEANVTITKAATCTENGVKTVKCSRCNETHDYVIPKLGHKLVEGETVAPTCDMDGYVIWTCDNEGCDVEYRIKQGDKTDHDWSGEWEVVKAATCVEDGVAKLVCKNNPEHVQFMDIPATGVHEYVAHVHEPTCEESGYTLYVCKNCEAKYTANYVEPLGHDWDEGHHIDPTCEEPGGTLYTCLRCGKTKLEDVEDPTGHNMGSWYFVAHPEVKNAYAKRRDCGNDGCLYFEWEKGEDDKINVYYKVEFYNPYSIIEKDSSYFIAGDKTKLAYEYEEHPECYETKLLEEVYVLKGTEAVYSGLVPTRPKTKAFGGYDFLGWSATAGGEDVLDLSSINSNMSVYAVLKGKDVYYRISGFYNPHGEQLFHEEYVLHGHSAEYPAELGTPTMAPNMQYKFVFKGWDRDIEHIYSSGPIQAVYESIPLSYKIVYHDWDGTVLGNEVFQYALPAQNAPTGLSRENDDSYIYEWTNQWVDGKGRDINLKSLVVPENEGYVEYDPANEKNDDLTEAEKGIYHVYARYATKIKYYRFSVSAVYSDGSLADGATVTVQDPAGQLVSTSKIDATGTTVITLQYYEYVTVTVTGGGEAESQTVVLGPLYLADSDNIPTIRFQLSTYKDPDHSDQTKCSCICHTFLRRIWVTFLNIIYRLFGKKTVCCPDMYENIGDQLVYGK